MNSSFEVTAKELPADDKENELEVDSPVYGSRKGGINQHDAQITSMS